MIQKIENFEFDVALSKQVGHVNNIPTIQVFTGISRNTQSKPLYAIIGMVFCIVHCMMPSAMMAYISVQCILDSLLVSVSTEPVYSDDQFAHSYSNSYKLNINVCYH